MKYILTILTFLAFANLSTAQTDGSSFNKEFSYNIQSLLSGNSSNQFRFRKYNENKAFRLGLFTRFNDITHTVGEPTSTMAVNVGVTVGKQWQKNVLPKWDVYSGVDLGLSYGLWEDEYVSTATSTGFIGTATSTASTYGVSLAPFAGVTYTINERFGVSAEAAFSQQLSYRNSVQNEIKSEEYFVSSLFLSPSAITFNYRF